jgi:hypothetical protein
MKNLMRKDMETEETEEMETIESTNILSEEVFTALADIKDDLEHGFIVRQRFRPRFLMEVSVLNDMKFPTPDAKYWQCNLERDTHFRNLVDLCFRYKEKIADIHILEAECHELERKDESEINKTKIEKKTIQTEHERNSLIFMRKEAHERVREITNWTDLMKQLEPKLEFSKDNPEEHMPKSYSLRFAREREAMRIAGQENAAHDLAGAMNIISLAKTAFDNPRVLKLIEEKKRKLGGDKNRNYKKIPGKQ